jgi:hypothetical protein
MITLKKNCRLTFLASLLALSFGSVQAQGNTGSSASSPTGAPQNGAASQAAQNTQATTSQTDQTGSYPAITEGSASGTGVPRDNVGSSGVSGNQAAQQGAANQQGPNAAAVYMMVPVEVVTANAATQGGCWVKLYDAQNFGGESLTLVGPTSVKDMSGPFGINWDDRVESVQTGQKAILTVFDDDDFEERAAQFKPGQQVADVSKRMGFFDEFGSIKVDCLEN